MKTQPFNIDILKTHKGFFLLNKLPKNSKEIAIQIQSPSGFEDVDFVNVYTMKDGSLLAAWEHPFQKLGLQNLIARVDDFSQIVNLYTIERVIDIYDKPLDSSFGVFVFAKSSPVDAGDWRCDRGYYGSSRFTEDAPTPVVFQLEDIIAYESFLSVAGVGHIFYMEISVPLEMTHERLNNSVAPVTTRTFQEILKLVYEWSVLAQEPFNDKSDTAVAAKQYFDALMFSEKEIAAIEMLNPMQIAQFLTGSTEARVRPSVISPMSKDIENILFDRLGSSSLAFIVSRNPEIWDFDEILAAENQEFEAGVQRFKAYYGIPTHIDIEETDKVEEIAKLWVPRQEAYVHNQLRNFKNKKAVLRQLSDTN